MKIMITGGCGFIGSNFIRYMIDNYPDYQITNLDLLTYSGNQNNLLGIKTNNYNFVQGNINDKQLVLNLMKDHDICLNFAAESHVDNSIMSPEIFVTTNINGTFNLLEQAKAAKLDHFIQISTDEVYGSLGATGLFTEQSPLKPNSPYSASKASADMLVLAFHETYGLPVNITRCSNNYGPYQHIEKLIPCFIDLLVQDKPVTLYGDGQNVRDWLYVEDHCRAIDLVMHNGNKGEVYNIGGNNEKTNQEITAILLDYFHKDDSYISYVSDRLGHDRRYAIDNTKISKELGFYPKYNFEEGIAKTIKWYEDNQNWILGNNKKN